MTETLTDVKDRLKARYLGRAGVHGMGVSRAQNAIRVYVNPSDEPDTASVLAQLTAEAEPYSVIVVREEPARLA
jgi:hypothetical protein